MGRGSSDWRRLETDEVAKEASEYRNEIGYSSINAEEPTGNEEKPSE
jgi:hypothetical protein